MPSLKITCSLASLILILGLVFATVPAMAVTTDTNIGIADFNNTIDVSASRFGTIEHGGNPGQLIGGIDATLALDSALPDLDEAFLVGTTIALLAPAEHQLDGTTDITGAANAVQAKDVVISEIMWGLDTGKAFNQQQDRQWIEFYNTTAGDGIDANMGAWLLYFVDDYAKIPAPAKKKVDADGLADTTNDIFDVENVVELDLLNIPGKEQYVLVDIVSNDTAAGGGWVNDIGQSGRVRDTTFNPPVTTNLKDMISMYRDINYEKVTKPDHDTDPAKNRVKQLEGIPSGIAKDSWKASQRLFEINQKGSPNKQHFKGLSIVTASSVAYAPFVINEFYVDNNNTDYNWLEIRNKDAAEKSLKNYHLSHATAVGTDTSLVNFHEKDIKIPGGGVLLIVATEPKGDNAHPIAAGVNAETEEGANAGDLEKNGVTSRYIVRPGIKNLPKDKILLILRSAHDKLKKAEAFVDVTGTLKIVDRSADFATSLWPLKRTGKPHGDTIDGKGLDFKAGTVYRRAKDGAGWAEHTWAVAGNDGPGYKRAKQGKGTPGYDNGAVKVFDQKPKNADGSDNDKYMDASKTVSISEIMYQSGRNAPQWMELYNSSMTQSVQLDEWQLKLENGDGVPIRKTVTVKLASKVIQPNQTVLIVAFNTNRNSGKFPSDRVIEIWKAGLKDKDKLEITEGTARTNFTFLSKTAFKVTLMDKAGNPIDTVGNMGVDPAWDLPALSDDGVRASIIRTYAAGVPTGWSVAEAQDTHYGNQDDLGNPGYRAGGPLPVSLSKFRPERLESSDIVIRWITESELNNAGFNILRSETRDGAFTQINTSLIAGQGTTSERTTYTWKDTSAKPTVVYYYQIQDVSLDGQVQTLRMSRLKGDITPAGKLTTTWGALKALQ